VPHGQMGFVDPFVVNLLHSKDILQKTLSGHFTSILCAVSM